MILEFARSIVFRWALQEGGRVRREGNEAPPTGGFLNCFLRTCQVWWATVILALGRQRRDDQGHPLRQSQPGTLSQKINIQKTQNPKYPGILLLRRRLNPQVGVEYVLVKGLVARSQVKGRDNQPKNSTNRFHPPLLSLPRVLFQPCPSGDSAEGPGGPRDGWEH